MLRKSRKPVMLVVNKVDDFDKMMPDIYEFYQLGIGDPHPISASSKRGLGDMLDALIELLPDKQAGEEEDERVKVAIIGKPNVGKSSLVNRLVGKDRVIVSDIAGTTRDAIDTVVRHDGEEYVFIDTAGIRRKSKVKETLERYSVIRAVSACDRADVVIVMIDATEGVTEQDAKIAGIAHENGKGLLIAVNKWDAIEKDDKTMYKFRDEVKRVLSFVPYAKIVYISAKTGKRLDNLFDEIDAITAERNKRIATGVLNEIIMEAVAMNEPPTDKGRRLKVLYASQVSVGPPTFVLFVNDKKLLHFSYRRYLENQIRAAFGFEGTPIRFVIRERGDKGA
jgi:GTP-binding protein